ncbi:MAG: sugar transferase [Oscillospiraceae bacterium]|nr:sugar transferase [Oscillospiraceae bacterium]
MQEHSDEYIRIRPLTRFIKRSFDLVVSFCALLVLSPFFLIIAIIICCNTRGPAFFSQKRVGRHGKLFKLHKFRSMVVNDRCEQVYITAKNDERITKVGAFIRKYKIDELPQFYDVFRGKMSIVGPRPEVPEYVALYTKEQRRVLSVKPGITDPASIRFIDEEQILAASKEPEKTYTKQILPRKLRLGLNYVKHISFWHDIKIMFATFFSILKKSKKK